MGIRDQVLIVEDGEPKIRWDRLGILSLGSIFMAYLTSVINSIQQLGSGTTGAIEDLANWIATVIETVISVPTAFLAEIWIANSEFLVIFGPFAPLVGVAQLVVISWLLLGGFERSAIVIRGVIS